MDCTLFLYCDSVTLKLSPMTVSTSDTSGQSFSRREWPRGGAGGGGGIFFAFFRSRHASFSTICDCLHRKNPRRLLAGGEMVSFVFHSSPLFSAHLMTAVVNFAEKWPKQAACGARCQICRTRPKQAGLPVQDLLADFSFFFPLKKKKTIS